ncbi:MAG TPA: hypothetical protein VD913_03030, partial [bacterium]|nr:hypothetical protein [bacterium]
CLWSLISFCFLEILQKITVRCKNEPAVFERFRVLSKRPDKTIKVRVFRVGFSIGTGGFRVSFSPDFLGGKIGF